MFISSCKSVKTLKIDNFNLILAYDQKCEFLKLFEKEKMKTKKGKNTKLKNKNEDSFNNFFFKFFCIEKNIFQFSFKYKKKIALANLLSFEKT